jgi:ribosomal protein L20
MKLIVVSLDQYEKLKAKKNLFEKLLVAQAQSASGSKGISHAKMIQKLKQRIPTR